MPAARKSVPVNTMSMSLRPAPCIAFSLPGNSGAGALVKLILAISSGCFFWYASIASCVSARLPATSTIFSVTGAPRAVRGNAATVKSAVAQMPAAAPRSNVRRIPNAGVWNDFMACLLLGEGASISARLDYFARLFRFLCADFLIPAPERFNQRLRVQRLRLRTLRKPRFVFRPAVFFDDVLTFLRRHRDGN